MTAQELDNNIRKVVAVVRQEIICGSCELWPDLLQICLKFSHCLGGDTHVESLCHRNLVLNREDPSSGGLHATAEAIFLPKNLDA